MAHSDLLGTTWVSRPDGDGRCRCPRCEDERDFDRATVQPRLVLLGRPLMLIGRAERFLTCRVCGHAFAAASDGTVDTSAGTLAEDERALLAVLAAVVFSDSAVRGAERRGVVRVIRHYLPASEHVDAGELLRDARQRWGDPITRLERLHGLVSEDVRCRIVEAAYHVCTADGELHREESRLLDRIGAALDLPPWLVRRAVTSARRHPLALHGDEVS